MNQPNHRADSSFVRRALRLHRYPTEDVMASCGANGGRRGTWVGLALVLTAVCGCGGPKTYPVKGKLIFDKGDVKLLSGSTLYCQQEQDPMIRAHGEINEDGSFALGTYAQGKPLPGAFE